MNSSFKINLIFRTIFLLAQKKSSSGLRLTTEKSSDSQIQDTIRDKQLFSSDPKDIHFYLYSNPNKPNHFIEIILGNLTSLKNLKFVTENNERIQIFTHGLFGNTKTGGCQELKNAWFKRHFSNVICVEWGKLAGNLVCPVLGGELAFVAVYGGAVKNTKVVGTQIANLMEFVVKNKVVANYDVFHLTGHSLGAHISGIAAYILKERMKGKVGQITGLDPGGLIYYVSPLKYRVDPSDAKYVQVLHTEASLFGISYSAGHVDYFVNGGSHQPQCHSPNNSITNIFGSLNCDHFSSIDYYARIILGEDMVGCRCGNGTFINQLTHILNQKQFCHKQKKCETKKLLTLESMTRGNYYLIAPPTTPAKHTSLC